jgi:hypothetical protein
MNLVACEECRGEGAVVAAVDVRRRRVTWAQCDECKGAGGFEVYGPPAREEAERREAAAASTAAFFGSLAKHVCTHCDRGGFDAVPKPPTPCGSCPEGIVMPLRDFQAASRGSLPVRRVGDLVEQVEPRNEMAGVRAVLDAACDAAETYTPSRVVAALLALVDGEGAAAMEFGPTRDLVALARAAMGDPPKEPSHA